MNQFTFGLLLASLSAMTPSSTAIDAHTGVIAGQISGAEVTSVTINSSPPLIGDDWSGTQHEGDQRYETDQHGRFSIAVNPANSPFYRLTIGDRTIEVIVEPGQQTRLTVPANRTQPIVFDGDLAKENAFLAQVDSALEKSIAGMDRSVFSQDMASFRRSINAMEQPLLRELSEFSQHNAGANPIFLARVQTDIRSTFSAFRLFYPAVHLELTGTPPSVPSTYYLDEAGGLLTDAQALSSRRFVFLLDTLVNLESKGVNKFAVRNLPREKLMSRYQAISALPAEPPIRDYLFEQMFRHFRINYGPADWQPILAHFNRDYPSHPLRQKVNNQHIEDMQVREQPDAIRVYRMADSVALEAHLFFPPNHLAFDLSAAYLTFHGGGWAIGTPEWSYPGAQRMAAKGLVAISFEYRIADVHGTGIFDGIDDVKAAIAWTRAEAETLGVDPNRIVAAGFSAGAHLAAASAIVRSPEESNPQSIPNALILHSSSYNTTKGRFFDAMTDNRAQDVSLFHNAKSGLVPTIAFHGRYDHLAPLSEFTEFTDRMEALENDFEYHVFDVGHFFRNEQARQQVYDLTHNFLAKRGFLDDGQSVDSID